MSRGLVNKILLFSSVDGPGNRTVIFLQGCNFDCLYCHNPETINICNNCGVCINSCPYNAISLENGNIIWNEKVCKQCDMCLKSCKNNSLPKTSYMSVDEVFKEINKVKSFISGITVSGGECTLQSEFLISLFKKVKSIGLTAFVDTNGSVPLYNKKELVDIMDMAMVDVKSYDPKEHNMLTGMDNNVVLENVKYLASINKLYEIRTVIVPELLNNYYNVDMISKLLSSLNPNIRYKIIKYRPIGVREGIINSYVPSDEMMNELLDIAGKNGCKNIILV
ncbi:YjjW family glycine radical enzyme activase [Tepidibacter formicigenes]|jgi:YjjW family glycine radical enzyme activase|uniref:Glycine radical enzyme activase, YjjW family n=1 Tax=Tepidibacter formicigenes DSM 15518 TaxID=1123349 RepID=A0A1M6KZA5_9FIRM|nr:YjjW family glycine radical enzyme activase [Tepidibacter formicigenes]SHJ64297.1 glycine radical enzyme activase, YjjW family [Tepidibacter formicigenes DSM 15518]